MSTRAIAGFLLLAAAERARLLADPLAQSGKVLQHRIAGRRATS